MQGGDKMWDLSQMWQLWNHLLSNALSAQIKYFHIEYKGQGLFLLLPHVPEAFLFHVTHFLQSMLTG